MTDDFLHNLRSSHRQRLDRNRKPYDNPQYRKNDALNTRDRKSGFNRRGTDPEAIGSLKKLMEALLESQKTLTQAAQAMVQAQQRQAMALECIAGALGGSGQPVAAAAPGTDPQPVMTAPDLTDASAGVLTDPLPLSDPDVADAEPDLLDKAQALPIENTPQMLDLIEEMQKNGVSYEKIARHLEQHQVPTPSGRGRWRGSLVSRIIKEQAVASATE